MRRIALPLLLIYWYVPWAWGETVRYVSDNLEVTLRSGKTLKHNILKVLPSGVQVTVIQGDADGYSKVRTKEGVEGWVLTRFLSSVPGARDRLAEAEQRLAALKIENNQLRAQITTLSQRAQELEQQRQESVETTRRAHQELHTIRQTAASSLEIDHENKMLRSHLVNLERELQTLQQENSKLKDRTARDWFLLGAGVVLLGMIVGLILPKLHWRKQSTWDSF